MDYPRITVPFAIEGDKQPIPDPQQSTGSISWNQGWGPDYQADLESDADAKPIDRLDMNQLFYVLSVGLQYLQESFAPQWISTADNGGAAYTYPQGATVTHNGQVWVSQVGNNTREPGVNTNWKPYLFRTASDAEITAESGNYPPTPQQVLAMINANAVDIPIGSTAQRGIVQLTNARNSNSQNLAATALAVSGKFNYLSTAIGNTNLDTYDSQEYHGIYYQASDGGATVANGYPEPRGDFATAGAGTLIVMGSNPMQIYFSRWGYIWLRIKQVSAGTWGAWVPIAPDVQFASTTAKGIVELATQQEATAGADGNKAIVPSTLKAALDGRAATQQEVGAGAATNKYVSPATLKAALDGRPGIPAGMFATFAKLYNGTPPSGFLVCNGAAVSRTTFARLFAEIGVRYGAGDGSTTFNLPNAAWGCAAVANNGNANMPLDYAGNIGTHSHTASAAAGGLHSHTASTGGAGTHSHSGVTDSQGNHQHAVNNYAAQGSAAGYGGYGTPAYNALTSFAGAHAHNLSINAVGDHTHAVGINNGGSHTHTITVNANGSARNYGTGLSGLMCISY